MLGAGALDGETAFLASPISKAMLFKGGVRDLPDDEGRAAFIESALKAVAALRVSAPLASEVLLSGRMAAAPWVREPLAERLGHVRIAGGFAAVAKHAAQGAALLAEGLAGGLSRQLVDAMGIRGAAGTVLDHLYFIDRAAAARRIGIA
jgi:predicted butyrate kinase (DUF1464 family)